MGGVWRPFDGRPDEKTVKSRMDIWVRVHGLKPLTTISIDRTNPINKEMAGTGEHEDKHYREVKKPAEQRIYL